MMNKLLHDAINKFHNINLRCGTLALELESGGALIEDSPQLKKRLQRLPDDLQEDLGVCHRLIKEITAIISGELNCYEKNEHFFKVIEPILSVVEAKRLEFENIVKENKPPLPRNKLIRILHTTEEKALACGIILKELRISLIQSGIYKIGEET